MTSGGHGVGSLAALRAVIPSRCYERSTIRGVLAVVRDVAGYAAVIALLATTDRWWLVLPLEVLAGLLVGALFILGHDASHGTLVRGARLNRALARALMAPSLHVEEAWSFGHNRVHHGFTTRQGLDFVWHPVTVQEYRALPRWARLRHRVEWSPIGAGAYYLRAVWWNKMVVASPPSGGRGGRGARWFVLGGAALATAGALALGSAGSGGLVGAVTMWLQLVVVPFLVYIQLIGWTVYVHHIGPDIRWWTPREWSRSRAQTESTTILRIPRALNVFFHHIFVHVPHHVDVRIPWYRLPDAARALHAAVPGTIVDRRLRVVDYLRATRRCKLYDFERGLWLTYAEAEAISSTCAAATVPVSEAAIPR
jgi:acyl-lipid omega-6 desaturase (Delta-12 desaturase)